MNIFDGIQKYATKYQVVENRPFSEEELANIVSCKVKASQYGMSCCFFMKSGCQQYIPLSRDSVASIDDVIDVTKVKVLKLAKEGEDESIYRIEL